MVAIPGYKIGERVGQGGISEVYEAWQIQDQRQVALKIIQEKFRHDHMLRTRLLREAKVIGGLKHRNIVQIFEFGTVDDRFYSIMEFLSQGSLSDYSQWTPRQLLKAMVQVCDGLAFVHKNHIIHRDLKPSNIMFGGDGIPRLVDFGISLFGDEDMTRLTQTNLVMGTLCYMSPEQQSQPKTVDARSDIYSLGTILYEIFTGTKPVGRFEDPSKINPQFSRDLERIILRCLEVQPENRYENVITVGKRLAQLWEEGLFSEKGERELVSFDDRIGYWLQIWREGSTKQRMEARAMMLSQVRPGDAIRFIELYKFSSREDRLVLIPLLARCPEPDVIPILVQALEDPMLGREACAAFSERPDPKAWSGLLNLAKSKNSHTDAALMPLAKIGGDKALKIILNHLKSKNGKDREAALKALELLTSRQAEKPLRKALQSETDPHLKQRMTRLVQRLQN